MAVRHLLSIADLDHETVLSLVENAVAIAGGHWKGRDRGDRAGHLLYMGEGNNSASAISLAVAGIAGMR